MSAWDPFAEERRAYLDARETQDEAMAELLAAALIGERDLEAYAAPYRDAVHAREAALGALMRAGGTP